MKKYLLGLIAAVVVILFGCNVWLGLELVDANRELVKAISNSVTARIYEWTNTNVDSYWIGYGGIHKDNR
jgi:hypothetical protein